MSCRRTHLLLVTSAAAVVSLVVPACGGTTLLMPECDDPETDTLVVLAQSVPEADLVPCVASMPPGWEFDDLTVTQEGATMLLSSDRGGDGALSVHYTRGCRTEGATQIPSDEAGAERYERVRSVSPTYSGVRYYTFPGGCVRYDVEFDTARVSGLLNEASLMMGFTTRSELNRRVRAATGGDVTDAP